MGGGTGARPRPDARRGGPRSGTSAGSSAGPPGPAQVAAALTAPPSVQTAALTAHAAPTAVPPAPAVAGPVQIVPDPSLTPPDPRLVEEVLAQALTDQTVSRALVEYRGYYPAKYSLSEADGRPHTAIIAAGQGTVYGERPPARRRTARDQAVLLGTAALLMAEAGFVPGLQPRLAAVLVTACAKTSSTSGRIWRGQRRVGHDLHGTGHRRSRRYGGRRRMGGQRGRLHGGRCRQRRRDLRRP